MGNVGFEWDANKNRANQIKHGVSFESAQYAFADTERVIAEDLSHSGRERRFYCFGKVGGGVLTVRFTHRGEVSESSAPDTGEGGRPSMKKKIVYRNEPLGRVRVVRDFLPSPEELAFKEDTVKVTLALSRESVDYFKRQAKKHHTKYQKMIRRLLDAYSSRH